MDHRQQPRTESVDTLQQAPQPALHAPEEQQSWQNVLVAMFNGFGQWAQSTNESQAVLSAAMQTLATQVSTLTAQTANLQQSLPTPTPAATPAGPSGSIRIKEPCVFSGKASEVEVFLDEVQNNLYLQCRQIITNYEQSLFLSLYLADGNPKSWYPAIKSSWPNLLNDFEALVEDFRGHFGDSNLESTAYRKIKALKQTGTCASYASCFCELVVHLDWTDKSKIAAFREGLKEQVWDLLITVHPKPATFNEFVKVCIEIDNAVYENELDKRHAKASDTPKHTDNSRSKQASTTPTASTTTP